MKVPLIISETSSNCLGRAYLLAKILARTHEVQVLGPIFGKAPRLTAATLGPSGLHPGEKCVREYGWMRSGRCWRASSIL